MEQWQAVLFQKVCKVLGVDRLLGQKVRFEVDESNYTDFPSLCCKAGVCGRQANQARGEKGIQNPEGIILATDFGEDAKNKGHWMRLFLELKKTDSAVRRGAPHYVEFDGQNWSWSEECGGYPGDSVFVKHSGELVLV